MNLRGLWKELGKTSNKLDYVENKVENIWDRPKAKGRETPFWATKQFIFDSFDLNPQESPLVHSAGSVTRVTRLSYSAAVIATLDPFPLSGPPPVGSQAFRVNPRALGNLFTAPVTATQGVFDFEWSFSIGSTERQYSTALPRPDGWNWLARSSLGNPETGSSMLFNPKHPLVLDTNEFLTFRVRPILSAVEQLGDTPRISLNISYAGYRTFGYEE